MVQATSAYTNTNDETSDYKKGSRPVDDFESDDEYGWKSTPDPPKSFPAVSSTTEKEDVNTANR